MSDPFYRSHEWKRARAQVLRLSGWRCAWCGADVRGRGLSRVDHIKPMRVRPDLALSLLNLRVLCATCDNRRHADKPTGRPVVRFGVNGEPLDPAHRWHR